MTRPAMPSRSRPARPGFRWVLVLVVLLWGGGLAAPVPLSPATLAARDDTPRPAPARTAPPEDAEVDEPDSTLGNADDSDGPAAPADEREAGDDGAGDEAGATDSEEVRVRFDTEASQLQALRGAEPIWTLSLPAAGGPTSTHRLLEDRLVLAHGLYLLVVDLEDGNVRQRLPLPAPGLEVVEAREGEFLIRVGYADDATETVRVLAEGVGEEAEPVRFDVLPAAFGWLRAGAEASGDPDRAAQRDPTDPWLPFLAAREAEGEEREDLLNEAVARARELPFFESAHLGLALADEGEPDRAREAMDAALQDFARRDYDPRLLTDADLRDAYGFPLRTVQDAVERGDIGTIELWADTVWRLSAEEAPETLATLHDLSRALRQAGERDAADLWRDRAADLRRAGLATWLDRTALSLGRFGWIGVVALLVGFALAWATLLAKVWRAQSLARMQRRERAEPVRPWSRIWVPRQASTTEKAALILMLVVTAFMAGLAGWAHQAEEARIAFRSGTLANGPAIRALEALPETPYAHFARGVSLHVRGEADEAEAAYRSAGERAPALVNLGLLSDDDSLLQAALRVDPRQAVARYHLGRSGHPSPFHEAYGGSDPLLAVPSPLEFALASGGDWREAMRGVAVAPWRALPEARPAAVPAPAWWALLVAYVLLLVALLVQLFVPRPRVARHAPRTPAYHPLAAAIPGSGHLDELWGLLLLIPWSIIGFDALLQLLGHEGRLALSLATEAWILALLWLANLVGFAVETASYRRRMRLLREEKPELARSYGLPPRPVNTRT